MAKNKIINVKGTGIVLNENNKQDFISLTDIARFRDNERSDYLPQKLDAKPQHN